MTSNPWFCSRKLATLAQVSGCHHRPLLAFRQGTDYIIHPFRGGSTSPCQKLARVLPSGIVDEPSSCRRSVEREARLLIAMPPTGGLGVPAIHFLIQCSLSLRMASNNPYAIKTIGRRMLAIAQRMKTKANTFIICPPCLRAPGAFSRPVHQGTR